MAGEAVIGVRRGKVADAEQIARLLHDFNTEFDEPSPGVDFLSRRCRQLIGASEITVLLAGEPPLGLAVLRFRPALWSDGLDCYLAELYVVPDRRGGGIGTALMNQALSLAKDAGAMGMDIGVDEPDLGARRFYERFGFRNHAADDSEARIFFYELEF